MDSTLRLILIVILILLLIGALPSWGYSMSWGYGPSGGLGLVLIIVLILVVAGKGLTGVCKNWNESRGFGFIVADDRNLYDVFCHYTEIKTSDRLTPGDAYEFDTEETKKGLKAVNVRQIAKAQA